MTEHAKYEITLVTPPFTTDEYERFAAALQKVLDQFAVTAARVERVAQPEVKT
jgi:hypothetical protein